MTRSIFVYMALALLIMPFFTFAKAGMAEWEFKTPGGNFIGNNDIFENRGTVLYNKDHKPFVTDILNSRFFYGYIAGETEDGFFLFNEKTRALQTFPNRLELSRFITEKNLSPLGKADLKRTFNLDSAFEPLVIILYIPVLFFIIFYNLKSEPAIRRAGMAAYLVTEGIVLSLGTLWLMIGFGNLFMTIQFGHLTFNISAVLNFALMIFSFAMMGFMLYLRKEIIGGNHPVLVLGSRFVTFVMFSIFLFWMITVLFTPSLPEAFWQGSF